MFFRINHVARDFINELLECVRSPSVEIPSLVAIRVHIQDRFFPEFVGMRLDPFGGSQQTRLLTVPRSEHDRAPRTPASFCQLAKSTSFCQHCDLTADWIPGAIDPRI